MFQNEHWKKCCTGTGFEVIELGRRFHRKGRFVPGASGNIRHGVPIQRTAKKGHFTTEERVLLGKLTYRSVFGQEYMHLVAKSVFEMKKAEIKQALEKLGKMPIALNDTKTLNLVGSLGGKFQERLEKIKADENRQQQRRNQ